ncbi:coiled-coil domain-containing protein [Quillaja saponaria]|uniref:Vacuolar ATPase assembly protein VMA22 n=1 Tax=Quillaja saponaria TaxID=32244 RepID=A0AAD7PKA6_QUISA|nr:coiled-coil domain-containing protein [Quillaja saponaria]KAJ7957989.1 coiled-coil domain-containing protein [Quillaja saponaria]
MEEQEQKRSSEIGEEMEEEEHQYRRRRQQQQQVEEEKDILNFLDSTDSYLTLFDSLSSTLRQGWLDLASARHSMGASRINSSLLDLKLHSAATSLQVTQSDVDPTMVQPCFKLCKWVSSENGSHHSVEDNQQLRYRGTPQSSETANKNTAKDALVDDHVQRARSKSLSVFGTLVSPRLRATQLSFERALEIVVEIANKRSQMLSSFDQLRQEFEDAKI